MGKKMDLRVIKTKKNIRDAFLKLRAENPPEKIRVTELCKVATINKRTFYKYYQDIYSLSEELENEIFDAIMNNFEDKKIYPAAENIGVMVVDNDLNSAPFFAEPI